MNLFRKKVGLALGSGGPRGLAHIGVIKVLEYHGIPIDCIVGSSAGALIGSFYACHGNIAEVERLALDMGAFKYISLFLDPSFRQGLVIGNKVSRFISDNTGNASFSRLKIPFKTVATDLMSGEPVYIGKGRVTDAVLASCAIPLVFRPVISAEKKILVDGGLSVPIPVDETRRMGADIVIASSLNHDRLQQKINEKIGFSSLGSRSISILVHHLNVETIKKADIALTPPLFDVHWRSLLNRAERQRVIRLGEEAMEKAMPLLMDKLRGSGFPHFQWFFSRIGQLFHRPHEIKYN